MSENNILNQLRNIENPFQCHSDVFNETHSFKLYQELINLYIEYSKFTSLFPEL